MKVRQVSVESRRSVKISTEYLTFSVGMVADLLEGEDEDTCTKELFKKCNEQVDDQIEDAVKSVKELG